MKILSVMCLVLSVMVGLAHAEWYENGTLHSSTVGQWKQASYANKLATAADWAISKPQIKSEVMSSGSMNALKPIAREIVTCVDAAVPANGYDGMDVVKLAASCIVMLKH